MKVKVFIILSVLIGLIFTALNYEKNQKIEQYLQIQTKQFKSMYDLHYHQFEEKSRMLYDSLVDRDAVVEIYRKIEDATEYEKNQLRKELYDLLKYQYKNFQYTKLKQLHFHLPNNESFLRMHKPSKFGDNLTGIRETVEYVNENHKSINGFEAGRVYSGLRFVFPITDFDLTHLGSVEVSFDISIFTSEFMDHFEVLSNFHIKDSIVDKKVWKQSKIDHYQKSPMIGFYLENRATNITMSYAKNLKNIKVKKTNAQVVSKALRSIHDGKPITVHDKKTKNIITFLPVMNPVTKEVVAFFSIRSVGKYIENKTKNFYFLLGISTLFILVTVLLVNRKLIVQENINKLLEKEVSERTKELKDEKDYIQTLIDTSPNIIVVSTGRAAIDANKRFLEFFNYNSIEEFQLEHQCICEYFKKIDNKKLSSSHEIEGENWCKYIVNHQDKLHTVSLEKDKDEYFFYITANYLKDKKKMLLTLQDITDVKRKDKLIAQQAKLASMGEMIGNIAHQWRQPLSVISTGVSGLQLEKEYKTLTDEKFDQICETINENTQYLSKTIDDFRNYIKGDSKELDFSLKNDTTAFLKLVDSTIQKYNIQVIVDLEEDINIKGYPTELIQCFINIFNNAKDVLIKNNEIDNRYIFITQKVKKEKVIIRFRDNGTGIPEDILEKIFEPYFTTKHQSVGTGLGLHMAYNIITEGMHGTLKAKNVEYEFDGKEYSGAEIVITLPLNR